MAGVAALGLALLTHTGVPPAQAQGPYPAVAVPASQQRLITSPDGQTYRLFVWKPPGPAPASGYPVIYFTDANAIFGTFVDALNLRSRRTEVQGVLPAVLVGIGYPTDQPFDMTRRSYDLTPGIARDTLPARPDGSPWPATGGADRFLDIIEAQVKPQIERDFPIDRGRQILLGHSFGGLFVLNSLFSRPAAFRAYIAGSPSIWFGGSHLLDKEKAFVGRLAQKPLNVDLLIAVGAYEQDLTPAEKAGPRADERARWKQRNRMIDNAREMAARLSPLAGQGLRVTFNEYPGEDHISVLPVLISRTLEFALRPPP